MPNRFSKLLGSLSSQEPAYKLIRSTAFNQWRLISINLISSVFESLSEGLTLAIIFLAVEVISIRGSAVYEWSRVPVVNLFPSIPNYLSTLPSSVVFLFLILSAVFIQGVQSLSRFINAVSISYFAARCTAIVTADIHTQILKLTYPCASTYKVGDLLDYAKQGPEAIRIQIEQVSLLLVLSLLSATYFLVLVVISPWMLCAVLIIGMLLLALQKYLLPRIRAGSQNVTTELVNISSRVTEDFQGLRLLHSTGQLEFADKRLRQGLFKLEHQLRLQAPRLAALGPIASFLPIVAIALIASLSIFILGNRSSGVLPSLITFVIALQRLTIRLTVIGTVFNALADNSGRINRLNSILSTRGKHYRRLGGKSFVRLNHSITFDTVLLQYSTNCPPSLFDVSFEIKKGQMVALVGPSGAGKSSIADLLIGLYSPTSGSIYVDNVPLSELNMSSWQQRLGVVSQDTFLFNSSISFNVSFGSFEASDAQIIEACKAAQAHDFIQALPDGYATVVGERGYRLSGGQRQRLSLARAILKNPELLILDEATSALDSQSEMLVQEAIERFESNHTVLVIAHRFSTIVRADIILVLNDGRIIQRGHHSELLNVPGMYRDLWELQNS